MSNIITGRQLRAARILAGLTQKQFCGALLGIEGKQRADIDAKFIGKDRGRVAQSRRDRICNADCWCAPCNRRCRSEGNSRPIRIGVAAWKRYLPLSGGGEFAKRFRLFDGDDGTIDGAICGLRQEHR